MGNTDASSTSLIPPLGERQDYIIEFSHTKPGIWILKRSAEHEKLLKEVVAHDKKEEIIQKAGGLFYPPGTNSTSIITDVFPQLTGELESAYSILQQDPMKCFQDFKQGLISMQVWNFICITDPWWRPRGNESSEWLFWDVAKEDVWVLNGDEASKLEIQNNENLTVEDKAKLVSAGAAYYHGDEMPERYRRHLKKA